MGKVGIFWVYDGLVLASSVGLENADQSGSFFDSPENHVDVWPRIQRQRAELNGLEYFSVPRGRVVFNQDERRFTVYLDKVLMTPDIQEQIRVAFSLPEAETRFERDAHYTTDPEEIERLFE